MRNSFPDSDRARAAKTREYYDDLIAALNEMVREFNLAMEDQIYHLDPRQILAPTQLGSEGRTYIIQRRNAFLKILVEGSAMIMVAFSYQSPSTGDLITPEFNRLLLDTTNQWRLYRFRDNQQCHVEGFSDEALLPHHVARDLLSRLAELSSMPSGTLVSTAL